MRHEHGFQRETPVAEAWERFVGLLDPIQDHASVPLGDARGRVLAGTVVADRDVPHYDRAAMDGWAVRAVDTYGATDRRPRPLEVAAEGPVAPGQAVRVHTGSPIPEGADAVVMIEDALDEGDAVEVQAAVQAGRHVGAAGEDVAEGEAVLEAGRTLTPSALALLKSLAIDEVAVRRRPSVAVIPTGEELVQADPAPGEVIETNGLLVSESAQRWGADPQYRDVVTDDEDALVEALRAETDADLIVTTGGSSVGERDRLPEAIDALGELVVHGVAIKPGHPVGLGHVGVTPVAMLPGYPVSCVVTAVLFVRRAIRHLGGYRDVPDPRRECKLTEKVTSTVGRRTYTRVRLERAEGTWEATPAMTSGAGILSSMARTDAIVEVPERLEGYNRGDRVTAVIWE